MKNKLLNFTICQLLIVIGMLWQQCVDCQDQKTPVTTENVTLYDRSFKKVLSRRKRFLLWRPGSNLLLTASLVKPLAFPRPGGHNLILEWDIFYPLPATWYRTTKAPPTTAPPPPPETTETIETWDPHDQSSGEIWMPGSGWTSDVLKTIADGDKPAGKRYWNSLPPPQISRNDWSTSNLFQSPSSSSVTQYQNPLLRPYPWKSSGPLSRNQQINFNQQYRQSLPSSSRFDSNQKPINSQREINFSRKGRSLRSNFHTTDESMDDNWQHHHAHRDRRDLYQRIESSSPFGGSFEVKSCLLRTICEAQHFLYPRGYSLLQDMLRVIFTMPIKEGDDDYNAAMQAKDQDCVSVYSQKCPMSILAFLLRLKS